MIPYTSPKYPKKLLEIDDYPVLLYVKGCIQPKDQQSIAVIGTRQASIYGNEMAEKISYDLAKAGITVVSGLARGIDTSAHKGALQKGRTIAVIGSGLADIYPQENLKLSEEIARNGALISEFPMATPPDRQNFPQRNRIVAAMTRGTLLIEAPIKSGAMLTVERAFNYKRKLFALPGRIDMESFKGNHAIIKKGYGSLIEGASDILESFEDLFSLAGEMVKSPKKELNFSPDEKNLLTLLPNQEISVDEIAYLTGYPIMKVNSLLIGLILKKVIREYPGKIYKKLV